MSCLYILMTRSLLVTSFAKIFSHPIGCLFIFKNGFLSCAKVLNIIHFHWYIFAFIVITLRCGSNKMMLWFMSKSVLPISSSRSFIISGHLFRPLMHFEFIFVYGIREWYNSILLHVAVQFFQHHLLRRLSFLHYITCLIFHRLVDDRCLGLFLAFQFCSTGLFFCFCPSTILFWWL